MEIDGRGYDRSPGPAHKPGSGSIRVPSSSSWGLILLSSPLSRVWRGIYSEVVWGANMYDLLGVKAPVRRLILVNSIIVWRQQTWWQRWKNRADTHHWEDDTYKHKYWRCCCSTVTKQQEASHTDHWHCIVIEIWVSASFSFSVSFQFFCQT